MLRFLEPIHFCKVDLVVHETPPSGKEASPHGYCFFWKIYAPINGIPGQMLEKEGEFGIGIFPKGLVLSRDCQNEL